jgi:hypothetical protein
LQANARISIRLAKAKLESQLELIRSQDGTNNGSPSDVSKRVRR